MSAPYADDALAQLAEAPSPFAELDAEAIRAAIAERSATKPRGPEQHEVRDVVIAGDLWGRLYRPVPGPLPVVLWLHGGGWTVGDVASHDRTCRRLADGSGCAILSLEYRLAPEHPWPASVEDTVAALRWLASWPLELGESPPSVAVGGDSAGGTLAALACLALRDDPALPDLQVLVYANTDLTGAISSAQTVVPGGGVDHETERWFITNWVPDPERHGDPDVSPHHASDLTGQPAALMVTCQLDPLGPEAAQYARRLRKAGVTVELRDEPGMVHNFLLYDLLSPASAAAGDRLAADLRRLLNSG